MSNRIALLSSTGGSVVKTLLRNNPDINLDLIITDRKCPAENISDEFSIPNVRIDEKSNIKFSEKLLEILISNDIDYVVVFFSRLLQGNILNNYNNKLINFHPALLPDFPGMNGFERAIRNQKKFIGSTVHFIDEGMDTGKKIIELRYHRKNECKDRLRHIVFSQQVASLNEVLKNLKNNRALNTLGPENKNKKDNTNLDLLSKESLLIYNKLIQSS
ncbi:Phosphoribosylglycinamide formyltransferase [Photorhabdus australis subsp. thailandensis]|uniref:phosphoribosylglycinamide formyltransferase 1 n=1 Tax=Photorhabdus australis subsp. thailandensis TaxID=2805096 RepID=A0A1C0U8Z8_9GAMM|nr:formyltransferase family protein [Photorhabdus australis]OCQ54401.1 Phosphoribosylglycinamide formyltransferase [Photorhabdus australis subsp. thailandensis]